MGSLIPGLPDDMGWECLVRVKLNAHHILREDIRDRVVVYDPENNSCKTLPAIPGKNDAMFCCHFVKQKLVLIADYNFDHTRRCMWLYDFACSKWRKGAKLPYCRNFSRFASAVDEAEGLIYVGGGYCSSDNRRWYRKGRGYCRFHNGGVRKVFGKPVRSASVYNVEKNKWYHLPDMNTCMEFHSGHFVDGKFYVMGPSNSFEVFDSYTRSWKTMENSFDTPHFVSGFGRFYCLSGSGLIEYDYKQDKLHIVGPVPTEGWCRFTHCAVVGNKIFVSKQDHTIEGRCFYMLTPPSETRGTVEVIRIKRSSGLQDELTGAATLDL
ncbi:hypothetical protein SUGI_0218420 [Cryptomeria japonica]|nr:hypothetical protein SUGI_0218420 [Cryptomeria japonica]